MAGIRGSTALIIPALNEEDVIGTMLSRIPAGFFRWVVVADNGSVDRTAEIARAHGAIVVHELERGYGAACLRAIAELPPDCEAVVFMQADASEEVREAELLLAPLCTGRADIVIGSRTLGRPEEGALLPHQAAGNRVATTLIRWLYGHRYTDLGPFRAVTVRALSQLRMRDRNYGWTVEMQVRALQENLKVIEIPVSYRKRLAGTNKVSGNVRASISAGCKIIWVVFRLLFRSRWHSRSDK